MTTIAYKAGIMAADSAITQRGLYIGRLQKIYRLKSGALLGVAGEVDARALIGLLDNVKTRRGLPSVEALVKVRQSYETLLVLPRGGVFFVEVNEPVKNANDWSALAIEIREDFAAVGSGASFARIALECGKTAREAVSLVCKYDIYSALPVFSVALREK